MKLSIIVPAHNEQDNIAEVLEKIEKTVLAPHELVVVNDHSADNTQKIVEGLRSRYSNIVLTENKLAGGFANAIRAGFAASSGDVLVPVMADLCDDLSTIEKMLQKIEEGYDVVCGSRYVKGGSRLGGSKLKGFLSALAGRSLHYLLGLPTTDIANAFKMYRKKVIEGIDIQSKGFEVSMEIPLKAYYSGFKVTETPTIWRERTRGKSSFKIFKLLPSYLKLYFWAVLRRRKT